LFAIVRVFMTVIDYDEDMKISVKTDENGNKHLILKDVENPDIRFVYSPYLLQL